MSVKVRRVFLGNDHEDTKWVVLEGYVDGVPQVTKRRAINTAALVSGHLTLEDERDKLVADVAEYLFRFQAVQEALKRL